MLIGCLVIQLGILFINKKNYECTQKLINCKINVLNKKKTDKKRIFVLYDSIYVKFKDNNKN